MCGLYHLNSKWEWVRTKVNHNSQLIHLESKFQNTRMTDCHSQQYRCANEIDWRTIGGDREDLCTMQRLCPAKGWELTSSFPIRFTLSLLLFRCISQHIPLGSKPALPPGKVKPWRSPAPCAATKSAAGKTRSNRGDRGSILDGWQALQNRWRNNIHGTSPPFRRHRCQSAKRVKRSLCCYYGYSQKRDVILMIHLRNRASWIIAQPEKFESTRKVPTHFRKVAVIICRDIQTQKGCA